MMNPVLITEELNRQYGEPGECYLCYQLILDKELKFSRRIGLHGTAIAFADSLEATINHFFDGEDELPLYFDGHPLFEEEYRFKIQGYEIFHSDSNHYKGVITFYYSSVDKDAVLKLLGSN